MRRIGRRVERRDAQAAKSRDRVRLARHGRGLLVPAHQLVHRVDDRRVEIPLVRPEHLEGLVPVAEERPQRPGQLDAYKTEQQRPRSHDGERLTGIYAALLAHDTQPLMQGVHPEQARHSGDEAEEAGQRDDREDGVSQLAAKPDRVDDLLEKLFSVAEQCFQEDGIARDPLIGGHGQALGVRASNLATILLFCQCLLMFDNVYNLIYVFRITGGRSVASAAAIRAAVVPSMPRFCASSSAARPRTRYNAASSCVSASTWRRIVAASPRATGPVSAASGPSRPRFSSVPSTSGRSACQASASESPAWRSSRCATASTTTK